MTGTWNDAAYFNLAVTCPIRYQLGYSQVIFRICWVESARATFLCPPPHLSCVQCGWADGRGCWAPGRRRRRRGGAAAAAQVFRARSGRYATRHDYPLASSPFSPPPEDVVPLGDGATKVYLICPWLGGGETPCFADDVCCFVRSLL